MILFLSIFFSLNEKIYAQSILYSDPFFEKIAYNPSNIGIAVCPEALGAFKSSFSYNLMSFSINHYFEKYNSSLAVLFTNLSEAHNTLNTISGGIIYAYRIKTGPLSFINTALQIDYFQKNIENNKLIFSNQINPLTGNIISKNTDYFYKTVKKSDISIGFSFFNKQIRTGLSVHHFDKIFIKNDEFMLYPEIAFNFGKIFSVKRMDEKNTIYLIPEMFYNNRYNFHQLIYGFRLINNTFLTGIFLKQNLLLHSFSSTFLLGINFKKFRISYAYEIIFSKYISLPISSNQISLKYNFECLRKRKNQNTIFCINL